MKQACDIIKRGGKQTALKVLWLLRRVYTGNHKKKYTLNPEHVVTMKTRTSDRRSDFER